MKAIEIVSIGTKVRIVTEGGMHMHHLDKGSEAIIERIHFNEDGSPLYEVFCAEQNNLVQYLDRSDFEKLSHMKIYVIVESYIHEYDNRFVTLCFSEQDAAEFCDKKESENKSWKYCCDYVEYESP